MLPRSPKRRRDEFSAPMTRLHPTTTPLGGSYVVSNPFLAQQVGVQPYPSPVSVARDAAIVANESEYIRNFQPVECLGAGSFGTVWHCIKRLDGQHYAIKKSNAMLENDRMLREVLALAAFDDTRHIVRYYHAWLEDGHLFIQMERMDCSLDTLIGKYVEEDTLIAILHDCLLGLHDIHSKHAVHMDIKPANLFRRGNKYKIGDLGVARPLSWRSRQVDEGDGRYLAKELLADEIGHLTKADIFSLGISLYELARGRRLPTTGEEYAALRRGDIPDLPTLSPRFNTVLLRMMHPDPERRPSARQVLKDPLFRTPSPNEMYYKRLCGVYRQQLLDIARCDSRFVMDSSASNVALLTCGGSPGSTGPSSLPSHRRGDSEGSCSVEDNTSPIAVHDSSRMARVCLSSADGSVVSGDSHGMFRSPQPPVGAPPVARSRPGRSLGRCLSMPTFASQPDVMGRCCHGVCACANLPAIPEDSSLLNPEGGVSPALPVLEEVDISQDDMRRTDSVEVDGQGVRLASPFRPQPSDDLVATSPRHGDAMTDDAASLPSIPSLIAPDSASPAGLLQANMLAYTPTQFVLNRHTNSVPARRKQHFTFEGFGATLSANLTPQFQPPVTPPRRGVMQPRPPSTPRRRVHAPLVLTSSGFKTSPVLSSVSVSQAVPFEALSLDPAPLIFAEMTPASTPEQPAVSSCPPDATLASGPRRPFPRFHFADTDVATSLPTLSTPTQAPDQPKPADLNISNASSVPLSPDSE